jgi:outer membrane protein
MLRVSQAYFDMLLAEESIATTDAQIAAIEEQLASAKKNFEMGAATITDTHEAQARFDLATAQKLAAESDLLVKREALRTLTGADTAAVKRLRQSSTVIAPQPNDAGVWADRASTNNLQVLLRQSSADIADREIEKQKSGHLPTVDLVATHGNSGIGTSIAYGIYRPGTDVDTTTVGVQLTMPIFAGGLVNSRAREAVALKDKALADLDQARRAAALNARQAYLGVSSGLAQIRAYEAAMTSSQSSVDSNKLAFKYGVRINIDVLNAQSQLYETRQKLIKARIDTLLSQLKLKSAVGDLSEDDLVAINGMLE